MKNYFYSLLIVVSQFCAFNTRAQQLIQGSLEKGSGNSVDVWVKPNFNNSTKYLYQLGFPIAFPASATTTASDFTVTLDAAFVTNFGNNYAVSVYPVAHNTSNTVKYCVIVLIRGGAGASNAQTWTSGTAFKVLNVAFNHSGTTDTMKVKLADFQDGGSDGQGNFYTVSGLADYYVTSNSVGNFYAISGQSNTGGNSSEGYVETIDSVILSARLAGQQIVTSNLANNISELQLYPSLAKDILNVEVDAFSNDPVTFIITDINGRLVLRQSANLNRGLNIIKIDVNSLAKGSYFIRLVRKMGKDKGLTGKFIKVSR
jgi:hypothetical protein